MSVKSKFKVNTSLVNDGKWFVVDTNDDAKPAVPGRGEAGAAKPAVPATVCRIKLRRTGQGNALWSLAFRKHTDGNLDELTADQDREFMAEVFADAVVADWENMQPYEDGVNVPFSREAVVKLLADPDWLEFRNWCRSQADALTPFQDPREEAAGN